MKDKSQEIAESQIKLNLIYRLITKRIDESFEDDSLYNKIDKIYLYLNKEENENN